jgi:phosphoglycolate phosphatase-like HAD superfamily hydrolase
MSKLDEFYKSDFWINMEPVSGAKEGLERLTSKGYSISVVTARGDVQKNATEGFLAKWFPGMR